MKKLLLCLTLLISLTTLIGCASKESKANIIQKETESIIQKQLVNGESLVILSSDIIKDSIPYVLNIQLQQLYDVFNEADNKFVQARDSYGYSEDEKFKRLRKVVDASSEYYTLRDSLKAMPKDYGYINLVNFIAKNTAGAELTSKAIVVYTDTILLKPNGIFILTSEYNQRIYGMLKVDESFVIESNKYGLINTDSMNKVLGFILEGQRVK